MDRYKIAAIALVATLLAASAVVLGLRSADSWGTPTADKASQRSSSPERTALSGDSTSAPSASPRAANPSQSGRANSPCIPTLADPYCGSGYKPNPNAVVPPATARELPAFAGPIPDVGPPDPPYGPLAPPDCTLGYSPCLPPLPDYDCINGPGNGPGFTGEVLVLGPDIYRLDGDGDGVGCDGQ